MNNEKDVTSAEEQEEELVPVVKDVRNEHSNRYEKKIVWEKPADVKPKPPVEKS